jgi:two-component system NtrC family sensor kinase
MSEAQQVSPEVELELKALKYVARIQNSFNEINDIQINIIRFIQMIIQADEVILFTFENENKNSLLKRLLGNRDYWVFQSSVAHGKGVISQVISSGKALEIPTLLTGEVFDVEVDSAPGLEVQRICSVPMLAEGQILGGINLLNPQVCPLPGEKFELLTCLVQALANGMLSYQKFQALKTKNINLETGRLEILNSRDTLRALFDNIPAGIYIIDYTFNLLAINKSRADRAFLPPTDMVGYKCFEKLFGQHEICAGCRVLETINSGRQTSRIQRQWMDDEVFVEWEISTFPIQNEKRMAIQSIIFEQDITEKRHLEANLIQSEKLAAVGQLAAGVAHEINNPLAAIIANAQILRRETAADDQDTLDSLQLIEQAGLRASQVVKNLLGLARKEEYDFVRLDINETILNAISLVQHEFNSRQIKITLDLNEKMPPAYASKDHIQGVWINLLMNAIDAIEVATGEITIHTDYQDKEFQIVISDNGQGIPPNKLLRIFEPFYTTKAAGRGTGLGLSVCNRIVKKHGGMISAESVIGQGASFTVTLPGAVAFKVTGSLTE